MMNVIDSIKNCNKCELCKNQKPLLDNKAASEIFWVGLSAKQVISEDDIPLSPNTMSGKLIKQVEDALGDISTYKTNLVKCVPLDTNQKLRYPNKSEIDCCFENLLTEINTMQPKIVFLLGQKVYNAVEKHLKITFQNWDDYDYIYQEKDGIYYVPVQHPSYIAVYKRQHVEDYIRGVVQVVDKIYNKNEDNNDLELLERILKGENITCADLHCNEDDKKSAAIILLEGIAFKANKDKEKRT